MAPKTSADARPAGSPGLARSGVVGALIQKGRVLDVDISTYTCRVGIVDDNSGGPYDDVPWMVPYGNFNQGEGWNFMPEVGSTCYVCLPSEQSSVANPFIIGWIYPPDELNEDTAKKSYRAGRELLNPGDYHFSTRDGNFIYVRRGGVVQIGATPICQQVFLPIRNVMQAFAENWEVHTPAGDMLWRVLRKDDEKGGKKRCQFILAAHENTDDPAKDLEKDPIALLKIGSHGDGDTPILTLLTRDKGGGTVQTTLTIDKQGNVAWEIKGDLTFKITGDWTSKVTGAVQLAASKTIDLEASDDLTAKGKSVKVTGKTGVTVEATAGAVAVKGATGVNLDKATLPVVVDSPDLKAFIQATTAAIVAIKAAISAIPGGAAVAAGIALPIPPATYSNPKVKA